MNSKRPLRAPRAQEIPETFHHFDIERHDEFYWLRERERPEVTEYLHKENAYLEEVLQAEAPLREALFNELKSRMVEDDASVPVPKADYEYYVRYEKGKQYPIHCRRPLDDQATEEILLDENDLAEGQSFFSLGVFDLSPNQRYLAYSVDLDGSERYTIHVKDLETHTLLTEGIPGTHRSLAWTADSQSFLYTKLNENLRPYSVWQHTLSTSEESDRLIYQENDEQLFVACYLSRDEQVLIIDCHGSITNELRYCASDDSDLNFKVIRERVRGIEYSVAHHHNRFFILTNDQVKNFRVIEVPESDLTQETEWVRGNEMRLITSIDTFADHLVVSERYRGLPQLRVIRLSDKKSHFIEFDDPTYQLSPASNPEFHTHHFRFVYSSLVHQRTVYEYNLETKHKKVLKTQVIPSGYNPDDYTSELLFFASHDGVEVPVSIVYRKDFPKDGSRPVYLYGYGSYGYGLSAAFSTHRLSLLDRGFAVALAHVRGGSELGRQWYEDGKFLKKKNTFRDFIACAEGLIVNRYTSKGELVIVGGSAGGMLIGAVINERPELFRAAVAHVPFVDVINTMLDDSLPLTTIEYDEWGNPNDEEYFKYMMSYSPYDNVKPQAYPHLLITAGLNDPRVTYWEPAKWCARLRKTKTDQNLLLLYTNMEAGHAGASGRYEVLKEIALEYAFILKVFGIQSAKE